MLDTINHAWGWLDVHAVRVVDQNNFGNVIFCDAQEAFWRIIPEELICERIADHEFDYQALLQDAEFQTDWRMSKLVELARCELGPTTEEECYCLKTPGVLGGTYEINNIGKISRIELLSFSGSVAEQIKELPDGGTIEFDWC